MHALHLGQVNSLCQKRVDGDSQQRVTLWLLVSINTAPQACTQLCQTVTIPDPFCHSDSVL